MGSTSVIQWTGTEINTYGSATPKVPTPLVAHGVTRSRARPLRPYQRRRWCRRGAFCRSRGPWGTDARWDMGQPQGPATWKRTFCLGAAAEVTWSEFLELDHNKTSRRTRTVADIEDSSKTNKSNSNDHNQTTTTQTRQEEQQQQPTRTKRMAIKHKSGELVEQDKQNAKDMSVQATKTRAPLATATWASTPGATATWQIWSSWMPIGYLAHWKIRSVAKHLAIAGIWDT